MKDAVEVGSDVMLYTSGFIKISLGVQKLVRGMYRQTYTLTAR
jgi:hypothetical protein